MNIVIRNYLAGSFLLEREPNEWDAIVLLDSDVSHTEFVAEHTSRHLYLRFDDIQFEAPGKRLATTGDIQRALNFAAGSKNLLVCCRAGQSRSAAIAFLIACKNLGAEAACNLLNPERHVPNRQIVELGAHFIECPVVQILAVWQEKHQGIKLTDHLHEIESEFDALVNEGARNLIVG